MGCGGSVEPQSVQVDIGYDVLRQKELVQAHADLVERMGQQSKILTAVVSSQVKLEAALQNLTKQLGESGAAVGSRLARKRPKLGVIRLDRSYPSPEEIQTAPGSFGYDVIYRLVPGLNYENVQNARAFTEEVEKEFAEGIKWLQHQGCTAVCGDSAFMLALQIAARRIVSVPDFMTTMVMCPTIQAFLGHNEKVLILTTSADQILAEKDILFSEFGFIIDPRRYVICSCDDIEGFDAVAKGKEHPLVDLLPAVIRRVKDKVAEEPTIKAVLLESSEFVPYGDAIRDITRLPVWDACNGADFFSSGKRSGEPFGVDDWIQELAVFHADGSITTPPQEAIAKAKLWAEKNKAQTVGVLQLDLPGMNPGALDIYEDRSVIFKRVPGLTLEQVKSGNLTPGVNAALVASIQWLESKGVDSITGEEAYMLPLQKSVVAVASVPVFMTDLIQIPMVSHAFDRFEKIAILTEDSVAVTENAVKQVLLKECSFHMDEKQFVTVSCQSVPGLLACTRGEKVDFDKVCAGVVKAARDCKIAEPHVRAFILEGAEMSPYADALRRELAVEVYDVVTCANFFTGATKNHPRFGINEWRCPWISEVEPSPA